MEQPQRGRIEATWRESKRTEAISVDFQFNPKELTFRKGVQVAEINIPGLDSPLLQFVRGQNETLSLDLFFDTTDEGMGARATSVTEKTDLIYELVKIDPDAHAPPVCEFFWHDKFPGTDVAHVGNQRRSSFKCIVERVQQRFTLFSPEGVPLRATLTVTLREYKTLDQQLQQLNLNSPDRTHSHVLQRGETLAAVSGRYYRRPGAWRQIADANGIDDPRRIEPGVFLSVPPIE
jgi:hypothetical protein